MKNYILKGLCYFFVLFSLLFSVFTLVAEAQSGHGGTTEVIARVEPETDSATEKPQPFPTQPSSSQTEEKQSVSADGQAIVTGEAFAWSVIVVLVISGMFIIVLRRRHRE